MDLANDVSATNKSPMEPQPQHPQGEDNDEPLLLLSLQETFPSYHDLARFLRRINFANASTNETLVLSPDLMRRVASYLLVTRVQHEEVTVTGCSSSDGRHDIASCLTPDETSWWMSSNQSMPGGQGQEYVEFVLTPPDKSVVRLASIALKIPPLPLGPLSVLEFVLLTPQPLHDDDNDNITWEQATDRVYSVANRTGWQHFELEQPLDVDSIRISCLKNQMSPFLTDGQASTLFGRQFESVGFYSIRFE